MLSAGAAQAQGPAPEAGPAAGGAATAGELAAGAPARADATAAEPPSSQTYGGALRRAWAAYAAGDPKAAEAAYREALSLQPGSEDAGLGLGLVLMSQRRWPELSDAMAELLTGNPLNSTARLRLALALYHQGRYEEALAEYLLVVERDPESRDGWLGVGWTQLARGELEAAKAACERAQGQAAGGKGGSGEAAKVGQPGACLAAVEAAEQAASHRSRRWRAVGELYGAYLQYSDPWEREDLRSVQAFLGIEGPAGLRLGVDVAESHSTLQYEQDDERVRAAGVGVSADGGLGWIGAHLLSQWVDNASVGASLVGHAEAGVRLGAWGPGVAVSAQRNSLATALQVEPGLRFSPSAAWTLSLGARMIGIWDAPEAAQGQGPGQGPGPGRADGQELSERLWSGSARVRWVPHPRLALGLSGWAGERRYSVESGGTVVSTTGDRFVRGLRLDVGADLTRWLAVWAALQADWGDELLTADEGLKAHDFMLYGGVLGLVVKL